MFHCAGTADGRFLKSAGFISHVYLEKSPESVFGNERPIKKKKVTRELDEPRVCHIFFFFTASQTVRNSSRLCSISDTWCASWPRGEPRYSAVFNSPLSRTVSGVQDSLQRCSLSSLDRTATFGALISLAAARAPVSSTISF